MSLFDEVRETFPELLSEMANQSTRLGLEDSTQMVELLNDRILVKGLFREWRKAIFRMLDCGLRLLEIAVDDTREHLDDDFPPVSMRITLYYWNLFSQVARSSLLIMY